MKVCSKCKVEKEIVDFPKNKSTSDGLHVKCKQCVREYREANSEKTKEYLHKYSIDNKDKLKEYRKEKYEQNKEQICKLQKDYKKEYRNIKREELNQKAKEYRLKIKAAKDAEKKYFYDKNKEAIDLENKQKKEEQLLLRRKKQNEYVSNNIEKSRQYKTKWRLNNKDKIVSSREKNKEEISRKQQERYYINREFYILRAKELRSSAEYKEKKAVTDREYYEQNKERISEYKKIWKKENREKCNESSRRRYITHTEEVKACKNRYASTIAGKASRVRSKNTRRSRTLDAGAMATSSEIQSLILNSKNTCYWCSKKIKTSMHIDHYIPLAKGGSNSISNLVVACAKCNLTKGAKDPLAFANTKGKLL